MEKNKKEAISRSYYLDTEVIEWLDKKATADDRSDSQYLNRLLRKQMKGDSK